MMNLDKDDVKYIGEMRDYLNGLKKQKKESPRQARKEAKEALIRTGVLDSEGKPKKSIVSWG